MSRGIGLTGLVFGESKGRGRGRARGRGGRKAVVRIVSSDEESVEEASSPVIEEKPSEPEVASPPPAPSPVEVPVVEIPIKEEEEEVVLCIPKCKFF